LVKIDISKKLINKKKPETDPSKKIEIIVGNKDNK
jgi:hypothetical protein